MACRRMVNGLQSECGKEPDAPSIGLDHRVQERSPGADLNEGQQLFAQCLRATIQRVRPVLVAEEHSEEALKDPPPPAFLLPKKLQAL